MATSAVSRMVDLPVNEIASAAPTSISKRDRNTSPPMLACRKARTPASRIKQATAMDSAEATGRATRRTNRHAWWSCRLLIDDTEFLQHRFDLGVMHLDEVHVIGRNASGYPLQHTRFHEAVRE